MTADTSRDEKHARGVLSSLLPPPIEVAYLGEVVHVFSHIRQTYAVWKAVVEREEQARWV